MFKDQTILADIGSVQDSEPLDVFFFTPEGGRQKLHEYKPVYDENHDLVNLSEMPLVHLALRVDKTTDDKVWLMHANFKDKGIGVWSLDQFAGQRRYKEIAAIKRVIA